MCTLTVFDLTDNHLTVHVEVASGCMREIMGAPAKTSDASARLIDAVKVTLGANYDLGEGRCTVTTDGPSSWAVRLRMHAAGPDITHSSDRELLARHIAAKFYSQMGVEVTDDRESVATVPF